MSMNSAPVDPKDRLIADLQHQLADARHQLVERTAERDAGLAREAAVAAERDEALEQQTATAEVLQVINASPGDLAPVFEAMLEKATTLCQAAHGALFIKDGERFRAIPSRSTPQSFAEFLTREPVYFDLDPERSIMGRTLQRRSAVQVADLQESEPYRNRLPIALAAVETGGSRTLVSVPMFRDNAPIGIVQLARQEVRPFTDKQVALLSSFAAQAVIAIENTRLITETREALEQQTATAEVLGVINASPGDLTPVFEAILEKALHLCSSSFGFMADYDGEYVRVVAERGIPAKLADFHREPYRVAAGTPMDRFLQGDEVFHVVDAMSDPSKISPRGRPYVDLGGARSFLAVPMRKDGGLLGCFLVFRQHVEAFSAKQIALVQNFAAQAVIAMENARLLGDLRDRTADLQQSLEYQTATSDVLQVISRSTFDLQPVLDTLVETATRLCIADQAVIFRRDIDDSYNLVANFGYPPEYEAFQRARGPITAAMRANAPTTAARAVRERSVIHIEDITTVTGYPETSITLGKQRTALGVPLLREGEPIGVLALARQRVEPFTERQIELVRTFADQAVIAIENARLLNELQQRTQDLQESLEYQTATSDVLRVISHTEAKLQSVLETLVETAARICAADQGAIHQLRDGLHSVSASCGTNPEYRDYVARNPIAPGTGTAIGRMALERRTVHIEDVLEDPEYTGSEFQRLAGFRSVLAVPLFREEVVIGSILLTRSRVEPFTDKQIELVRTFADQAVIAIENARLLDELRQRTEEVAELNRGLEARVAEQVDELGRVGRLKRFLAPQLAELIVSQGDEKILESHRREIVVVFCDLRGYTAFTETAEPEEVLDFLREYHGALGPLVSQFEGTLDQFSGDGIMVFFNDPVPIPDPAERSVKMAMAMREAANALIASWRRRRGRVLGFGVGIAQGYATLGQIGFAERSGYTAIGTVCNLAARLCAEAKDGQILVAQSVAVAVEDTTPLEEMGELNLKGLTQPVVAYNVLLTATQPALRVIEGGPLST